jgi:hypothetical protein
MKLSAPPQLGKKQPQYETVINYQAATFVGVNIITVTNNNHDNQNNCWLLVRAPSKSDHASSYFFLS